MDFDGVFSDALSHHLRLANELMLVLGHTAQGTVETIRNLDHLSWDSFAVALGLSAQDAKTYNTRAAEMLTADAHIPNMFPGMSEGLRLIPKAKERVIIVTNNADDNVWRSLRDNLIDSYVGKVIGLPDMRPKHTKILDELSARGISPEKALMIGDGASDISAAKKAGIRSIAVDWGFHSREKLQQQSPTFMAPTPESLFWLLTGKGV